MAPPTLGHDCNGGQSGEDSPPGKEKYEESKRRDSKSAARCALLLSSREGASVDKICRQYYEALQMRSVYQAAESDSGSDPRKGGKLPKHPDRVLDAPGLVDDFYLNVLDWSVRGQLAVALGSTVYLWTPSSSSPDSEDHAGTVEELCTLDSEDDIVSSLSWIHDGSSLAIGTGSRQVQIWDAQAAKRVRTMLGQEDRIGTLAWNKHLLTSGSRAGLLLNHDVRVAKHLQWSVPSAHRGEICGLRWSWDGRQLASGANDNIVNVWDASLVSSPHSRPSQPQGQRPVLFTMADHQAAVKALSWCPWQSGLLATGGGSADRQLRFFCTRSGQTVAAVDTGAQVSALLWSRLSRELVSVHGYANNELQLWRYPSPARLEAQAMAHPSRILHAAMSPDGQTVVTAGADESLRFWRIFSTPGHDASPSGSSSGSKVMIPRLMSTLAKNRQSSAPRTMRDHCLLARFKKP